MASRPVQIKSVEEFLPLHSVGLAMFMLRDGSLSAVDTSWSQHRWRHVLAEEIKRGYFVYLVEEDVSPITEDD